MSDISIPNIHLTPRAIRRLFVGKDHTEILRMAQNAGFNPSLSLDPTSSAHRIRAAKAFLRQREVQSRTSTVLNQSSSQLKTNTMIRQIIRHLFNYPSEADFSRDQYVAARKFLNTTLEDVLARLHK